MLPSSSPQVARYGHVNHYKKFWLLQTQLEKQEQSATSSLSLGNACISTGVKEHSKTSSTPLVAVSGDIHHHASNIAASPYGTCRADMAAASSTNGSGRVIDGGSSFSYCSNERPICASADYYMHLPGYNCADTRLSLAVNYENVSRMQEYESSESSEVEKRVCNTTVSRVASSTSSAHLRIRDQLHGATEFQSRNIVHFSQSNSPLSAPFTEAPLTVSSGHLRTCSLCGTTKTPLWRSGPDGPKSLCNACGIRVKKTKRLQEALQATNGSSPSSSTMSAYKGALKRKLTSETRKDPTFQKKKRSTSIHIMAKQGLPYHDTLENKSNQMRENGSPELSQSLQESGKDCANFFAKDVEEAAVLLMALSCGRVLA